MSPQRRKCALGFVHTGDINFDFVASVLYSSLGAVRVILLLLLLFFITPKAAHNRQQHNQKHKGKNIHRHTKL